MASIIGTGGNDVIPGTIPFDNSGSDTIDGLPGDDALFGGLGKDTLFDRDGMDSLFGEGSNHVLDPGQHEGQRRGAHQHGGGEAVTTPTLLALTLAALVLASCCGPDLCFIGGENSGVVGAYVGECADSDDRGHRFR